MFLSRWFILNKVYAFLEQIRKKGEEKIQDVLKGKRF